MSSWPLDLWSRVEAVVVQNKYMAANEEFAALRNAVAKASEAELQHHSAHGALAWEFLLGFAERKPQYRKQAAKVAESLAAVPSWRAAYASQPRLRELAAVLPVEVLAALEGPAADVAGAAAEAAAAAAAAAASAAAAGPTAAWPNWTALRAAVATGNCGAASDGFGALRKAVREAGPADVDAQRVHAGATWEFLIGFAEKKNLYRAQIASVAQSLMAVGSWRAAWAARPELHARVAALHTDLQDAFQLERGGTAPPPGSPGREAGESHGQKAEPSGPGDAAETNARSEAEASGLSPSQADIFQDDARPSSPGASGQEAEVLTPAADVATPPGVGAAVAETDTGSRQPEAVVKAVRPYLQRAAELEADEPLVAHYCRIHAIELLMRARAEGTAGAGAAALLLEVFGEAEAKKRQLQERLDLSAGPAAMEAFAARVFENANAADLAGPARTGVPQQLYLAGLFLDVLAQFHGGTLPPALAEASRYAKRRALHVRACLQSGADPGPPGPPEPGVAAAPLPAASEAARQAASIEATRPSAPPVVAERPATVPQAPQPLLPAQTPGSAGAPAAQAQAPAGPRGAAAPAPVVAQPLVEAAGAAARRCAAPPAAGVGAGVPAGKRLSEARRRAELAGSAIEGKDAARARALIREAIALLEGAG